MKGKLKVNGFWQEYTIHNVGNEYCLSFKLLNFPPVFGKYTSEAAINNAILQLESKGYKVSKDDESVFQPTKQDRSGDGC